MARINIEETWWHESRRDNLGKLLEGIPFTAQDLIESVMVRAWRGAQKYWEKGELIPGHVFLTFLGADAILLAGLASVHAGPGTDSPIILKPKELIFLHRYPAAIQRVSSGDPAIPTEIREAVQRYLAMAHDNYISATGSGDAFKWAVNARRQRVEAAKISAKRPRDSKGRLLPSPAAVQRSLVKKSSATSEIQHSVSVSVSDSDSASGSTSGSIGLPLGPEAPSPTNEPWESYREAFVQRWKTVPVRNARINGQIAQILRRIPSAEVPALMKHYVNSDHDYYVKNMHKVGDLLRDAETVYAQMKGGITITATRNGYANGKAQQTTDLIEHNRRVKEEWLAKKKEKEANENN